MVAAVLAGLLLLPFMLMVGLETYADISATGHVVDPPISSTDAAWVAAMVAVCGWLAAVGLLAIMQYSLHHLLDRRRYRAWSQEWEIVARNWNNPAGETGAGRR